MAKNFKSYYVMKQHPCLRISRLDLITGKNCSIIPQYADYDITRHVIDDFTNMPATYFEVGRIWYHFIIPSSDPELYGDASKWISTNSYGYMDEKGIIHPVMVDSKELSVKVI